MKLISSPKDMNEVLRALEKMYDVLDRIPAYDGLRRYDMKNVVSTTIHELKEEEEQIKRLRRDYTARR